MRNYRVTLKPAQIRRINRFLRNWAKASKSEELADLYLSNIIRGGQGSIVLKGSKNG